MKVLMMIKFEADIPSTVHSFRDLPIDNLFVEFVSFIKSDMNCNYLSKKLIRWFNETSRTVQDFTFRFRGKESNQYISQFLSKDGKCLPRKTFNSHL